MKSYASNGQRSSKAALCILAAGLLWLCAAYPASAGQPAGGNRFDLTVEDIELTELLNMIAANNRVSIVCSSDVTGKVSVNFFDVTLEEALDAILTVNGLTFTRRGGVIHVHKPEAAVKVARSFELKWADPEQIVNVLDDLRSDEGVVSRSDDSVVVVVRDEPQVVEQMAAVVAQMDAKPRQVLITTWVMELGDSDLEKLGVNWASLDSVKIFEFTGEATYQRTHMATHTGPQLTKSVGTVVDLRAGILADNEFNLLLSFFETLTKSKVVSEPRIMTLENRPANIIVGKIVPIPLYDFAQETGTRILSGFQEQKVGTEVTVTPRVHSDSYITLDINPKVEQIVDYILVNGEKQRPIVSTRQAQTTVMVKSGDIVVIGGLRDRNHTLQVSRVPFFHTIPLIGGLFKNKTEDESITDLTIFIRPELFDEDNPLTVEEKDLIGSLGSEGTGAPANGGKDRKGGKADNTDQGLTPAPRQTQGRKKAPDNGSR